MVVSLRSAPADNHGYTTEPNGGITCGGRSTSVAKRAGDELQSRREMIRFSIIVGIVITIFGLSMGLYYLL